MYQVNTLYNLKNVMCQLYLNKKLIKYTITAPPHKKTKTKTKTDLGKAIFITLPNL